jgi:hypothetical protein
MRGGGGQEHRLGGVSGTQGGDGLKREEAA